MKCNISMSKDGGLFEVDGTEVKDFPVFRAFVHKTPGVDIRNGGKWTVTEFFTGMKIASGRTRKSAIINSIAETKAVEKKKIIQALTELVSFPLANYYTKWR